MLQWTAKFKHTIQDGKKFKKEQKVVLLQAVNYTDAETSILKFIETEKFNSPSDPDVSKHQMHEILGYDPEKADDMLNWWKFRIKCTAEDDKGKISIFYVRYLVYAADIEAALKLVKAREKKQQIPGEIEAGVITKLDYMLVPIAEPIQ